MRGYGSVATCVRTRGGVNGGHAAGMLCRRCTFARRGWQTPHLRVDPEYTCPSRSQPQAPALSSQSTSLHCQCTKAQTDHDTAGHSETPIGSWTCTTPHHRSEAVDSLPSAGPVPNPNAQACRPFRRLFARCADNIHQFRVPKGIWYTDGQSSPFAASLLEVA